MNTEKDNKEDLENNYRKISDDVEIGEPVEDDSLRKLWTVSVVCLGFMIIEVIGGYIANSIAIMSDAAHLFSDLLGFIISIVSIYIAKRSATHHMSYGFHRAEVIGALVSVTIIWGLTVWLIWEATLRILTPSPVNGGIMLIVAILGLLFNVVMGLILAYENIDHGMHNHSHGEEPYHTDKGPSDTEHPHNEDMTTHLLNDYKNEEKKEENHNHEHGGEEGDHQHNHDNEEDHGDHDHDGGETHSHNQTGKHLHDNKSATSHEEGTHGHSHEHDDHDHSHGNQNINVKAAIAHVIGDAIQNIGVIVAGAVIYFRPDLVIADALCTFFFAILVFFTTTRILKDCVSVIMEGSPIDNVEKLKKRLLKLEGVTEVHDIHVWSLSMGKVAMTCHLKSTTPQTTLLKAKELMMKKYEISHTTIQVEGDDHPEECKQTLH